MKILWFTNSPCGSIRRYGDNAIGGGWLISLEDEIKKKQDIELNVCFFSKEYEFPFDYEGVHYIPICRYPDAGRIRRVINRYRSVESMDRDILHILQSVVETINPDIVHIHGTEDSFGIVAPFVKSKNIPVVYSIQGLIAPYKEFVFRGLAKNDAYKLDSFRDKIHAVDIHRAYKSFCERSVRECTFLKNAEYIFGRTFWDRECTLALNLNRKYYVVNEIMRPEFYQKRWKGFDNAKRTYTLVKISSTISGGIYKGMETVLKTASLLQQYSSISFEWHIAGYMANEKWVNIAEHVTEIKSQNVNVKYHGRVDAETLSNMLVDSDIYVHVSHIENSPNSVCEAMLIGVPTIASYAGGTASILKDDVEGKLYQDGDSFVLAGIILDYIQNPEKMCRYANNARKTALERHAPERVAEELCNGYKSILQLHKDK